MATTLKDIAKKLNISQSTVSYALNGGPRPVPEKLKEQIVQTARELNYRPNRVARAMVTGRSHTIGVIFPELIEDPFSSVYHQLALNGIANKARQLNQDVLLFTGYRGEDHEELISMMADGRVDGVVFIAPYEAQGPLITAASNQLPCVIVAGEPPKGVASFGVNNMKGMDQALQHLYDLGHRKIGHVAGDLGMLDARMRLKAYRDFLKRRSLRYREDYVRPGNFLIQGGRMARGALYAALELELSVPEDLSVVGFGMIPGSEDTYPPLTTVNHPVTELASEAFDALLKIIKGDAAPEGTVLDTELVVRMSTAAPRGE
jgi:DNA-binding LacI/PurR family transcriptional regulator